MRRYRWGTCSSSYKRLHTRPTGGESQSGRPPERFPSLTLANVTVSKDSATLAALCRRAIEYDTIIIEEDKKQQQRGVSQKKVEKSTMISSQRVGPDAQVI